MRTKLLSLLIILSILLNIQIPAYADDSLTNGEKLQILGLIAGDNNGNLHPDAYITRQEMIAIVNRMTVSSTYTQPTQPTFEDVPVTHWATT